MKMRRDVPEEMACRLMGEYVAAWNSHDADRLASLFVRYGSYGEFGLGTVMLGRQEIRRYLVATFAALPDLTITASGEPLSSGERVFWRWLMTATHQGEFAGMPPTGKRFELRGISLLLTRGDKVVRAADCFDVTSVGGRVAAEGEGRSGHGSWSTDAGRGGLSPRLGALADEDNIGYGE
jgi:steroid delta-isomerase-like uncharacterized protein